MQPDPIGFEGGINLYAYAYNSPLNWSDPSGLWIGYDDAIFAGVGALSELLGQGISDIISGEVSSWETYVGSAAGGAVAGETLLYTGNPWLAGGAGGAASSLTRQGLENVNSKINTGEWSGFDGGDVLISAGTGALLNGLLPGAKINGLNAGSNSFGAISKQIVTKAEKGLIKKIAFKTGMKMFAVGMWENSTSTVVGGLLTGGINRVSK